MIESEKAEHHVPVSLACQLLGVSRSGYNDWATRAPSDRAPSPTHGFWRGSERSMTRTRKVYGAPRIHAELRMQYGIRISRKRVERLMREDGLSGLIVKKHGQTTVRVLGVRVADDLVERQFRPDAPNVLWLADFTYLRTWEGWLYLAAVQDAYRRRIVGWSMADHMRTELVVDALTMAVHRRRPDAGLIHHSDQGGNTCRWASGRNAPRPGSRGRWDPPASAGTVAETFFATLKKELVYRSSWPTRRELTREVFEYIEAVYNPRRRHSTLGYLSPVEFEEGPGRSAVQDPR